MRRPVEAAASTFRLLTDIVLIKRVHTGEVDGQGLEGGRQADATLRALHVEPRCWRWLSRLSHPRLGILHAEHGTRRLDRLSQTHQKREKSPNPLFLSPNVTLSLHWKATVYPAVKIGFSPKLIGFHNFCLVRLGCPGVLWECLLQG